MMHLTVSIYSLSVLVKRGDWQVLSSNLLEVINMNFMIINKCL